MSVIYLHVEHNNTAQQTPLKKETVYVGRSHWIQTFCKRNTLRASSSCSRAGKSLNVEYKAAEVIDEIQHLPIPIMCSVKRPVHIEGMRDRKRKRSSDRPKKVNGKYLKIRLCVLFRSIWTQLKGLFTLNSFRIWRGDILCNLTALLCFARILPCEVRIFISPVVSHEKQILGWDLARLASDSLWLMKIWNVF